MRRCSPCWCTPRTAESPKIDKQYLPKLTAIEAGHQVGACKTAELLKAENREDQKRALEGQPREPAPGRRGRQGLPQISPGQQREQVARARQRATHDLRIADNTFETVEASFQLKNLMKDFGRLLRAIQRPGGTHFDQIFKNEELRREFENLTRKLDAPSS